MLTSQGQIPLLRQVHRRMSLTMLGSRFMVWGLKTKSYKCIWSSWEKPWIDKLETLIVWLMRNVNSRQTFTSRVKTSTFQISIPPTLISGKDRTAQEQSITLQVSLASVSELTAIRTWSWFSRRRTITFQTWTESWTNSGSKTSSWKTNWSSSRWKPLDILKEWDLSSTRKGMHLWAITAAQWLTLRVILKRLLNMDLDRLETTSRSCRWRGRRTSTCRRIIRSFELMTIE